MSYRRNMRIVGPPRCSACSLSLHDVVAVAQKAKECIGYPGTFNDYKSSVPEQMKGELPRPRPWR